MGLLDFTHHAGVVLHHLLDLAPALAGLVGIFETPVDGAAAGIAAGFSESRDTGELDRVSDRGLDVTIGAAASTEAE